jgi:hypothetical protein
LELQETRISQWFKIDSLQQGILLRRECLLELLPRSIKNSKRHLLVMEMLTLILLAARQRLE